MSIQWSKDRLLNKWYWYNLTGTCKIKETRSPTYTMYHNKLKIDKIINISHDTIKLLEENIGRKISDIAHSKTYFLKIIIVIQLE